MDGKTHEECLTIQAIFSVVQSEAAMMRSPSFSLSMSSTTTMTSPAAIASSASSMGSSWTWTWCPLIFASPWVVVVVGPKLGFEASPPVPVLLLLPLSDEVDASGMAGEGTPEEVV